MTIRLPKELGFKPGLVQIKSDTAGHVILSQRPTEWPKDFEKFFPPQPDEEWFDVEQVPSDRSKLLW